MLERVAVLVVDHTMLAKDRVAFIELEQSLFLLSRRPRKHLGAGAAGCQADRLEGNMQLSVRQVVEHAGAAMRKHSALDCHGDPVGEAETD